MKSIEFNHQSQKWEVHEARSEGNFTVVGAKLSEHESREDAKIAAGLACDGVIDLSKPCGQEKSRSGFQPHWVVCFLYNCPKCGASHRVRANSFLGRNPVSSVGGIICGRPV